MGAIRLFLAYGVVLGHECESARNFQITCDAGWTLNVIGGRSVVFFYIVSGFLMSYVLDTKYPRTEAGTYQFYKSRFLRIYPLWWAMLVFSTVTVSAAWLHQSPLGIFSAIFLFGSDWLVPFAHYPEQYFGFFPFRTEIGWTLGAEMTFYLLAPWLLRSDRLALAVLVGSLAVRVVVFFVVGPQAPSFALYIIWSYFFLPSTIMFFMLGHLARRVPYIGTAGPWPSFAIFIAAVWFVSRTGWPPDRDWFPINDYAAVVLFALALPGIFEATKNNRVSNWLGDLTYPLYLTHDMTMSAVFGLWGLVGAPGLALVNFAKSFELAIRHGRGAICTAGDRLFAGRADRPRAGRTAATARGRAAHCRAAAADLATAGHGGACCSTGGVGSGGQSQLAAPGAVTPAKRS